MIAKRALIYAKGGGCGHAMRGARIAQLLSHEGIEATVVIREGADRYLKSEITRVIEVPATLAFDTLVVDTFPRGWRSELTEEFINSFAKKIFVARYNKLLQTNELEIFDEVWDPSPAGFSEWDVMPANARSVGWLVRPNPFKIDARAKSLLVVNPTEAPTDLFEKIARKNGFHFEIRREIPETLEAEKIVVIGAGYNTVYELWNLRESVRYVPLDRRFDDQHRRVSRLNLGVTNLQDFEMWLTSSQEAI